MCACVYVCRPYVFVSMDTREGVKSPEAELQMAVSCQLQVRALNSGALEERHVFFTEPPLCPQWWALSQDLRLF